MVRPSEVALRTPRRGRHWTRRHGVAARPEDCDRASIHDPRLSPASPISGLQRHAAAKVPGVASGRGLGTGFTPRKWLAREFCKLGFSFQKNSQRPVVTRSGPSHSQRPAVTLAPSSPPWSESLAQPMQLSVTRVTHRAAAWPVVTRSAQPSARLTRSGPPCITLRLHGPGSTASLTHRRSQSHSQRPAVTRRGPTSPAVGRHCIHSQRPAVTRPATPHAR